MGGENPILTLGYYSRPSHEGYRNTIELPDGNNVVPLRSDTIRLVQNRCSFHGLRSEDPNQHLKDFLKLMDSLDLDVANRERTRMRLFQFFLRDQASNWPERLPAGSFNCTADGKLRDKNAEESWEIIENLALYDHEGWNDPRDFNSFTFQVRARPDHQHQSLEPSFKARVRSYMAAHTEIMERFEKTIFKQREEINDRMAEMFGLLKELTQSRTPRKVLVREEARHPITKNVNSISLVKMENEKNIKSNKVVDKNVIELSELNVIDPQEEVDMKK
ncbi:hypothetical protein Tco_0325181 [Tanacetum coccineum]